MKILRTIKKRIISILLVLVIISEAAFSSVTTVPVYATDAGATSSFLEILFGLFGIAGVYTESKNTSSVKDGFKEFISDYVFGGTSELSATDMEYLENKLKANGYVIDSDGNVVKEQQIDVGLASVILGNTLLRLLGGEAADTIKLRSTDYAISRFNISTNIGKVTKFSGIELQFTDPSTGVRSRVELGTVLLYLVKLYLTKVVTWVKSATESEGYITGNNKSIVRSKDIQVSIGIDWRNDEIAFYNRYKDYLSKNYYDSNTYRYFKLTSDNFSKLSDLVITENITESYITERYLTIYSSKHWLNDLNCQTTTSLYQILFIPDDMKAIYYNDGEMYIVHNNDTVTQSINKIKYNVDGWCSTNEVDKIVKLFGNNPINLAYGEYINNDFVASINTHGIDFNTIFSSYSKYLSDISIEDEIKQEKVKLLGAVNGAAEIADDKEILDYDKFQAIVDKAISENVDGNTKEITDAISDQIKAYEESTEKAVSDIKDSIGDQTETAVGWWGKIVAWLSNIGSMITDLPANIVNAMQTLWDTLWGYLLQMIDQLSTIASSSSAIATSLGSDLIGTLDDLGTVIDDWGAIWDDVIPVNIGVIKDGILAIPGSISDVVDKQAEALLGIGTLNDVVSNIKSYLASILAGVTALAIDAAGTNGENPDSKDKINFKNIFSAFWMFLLILFYLIKIFFNILTFIFYIFQIQAHPYFLPDEMISGMNYIDTIEIVGIGVSLYDFLHFLLEFTIIMFVIKNLRRWIDHIKIKG